VHLRPATPDPAPAQLPSLLERVEVGGLDHDDAFDERELVGAALADQHARGVTFASVKLTDVDLSSSRMEHLGITDGVLDGCNLANLQARGARIKRVRIERSRLTGIHLAEAVLTDVTFRDCRIDLASFGFSHLQRVAFEDCILSQTDFLDARLDSIRFHGCELTHADFRGARLRGCEFRRSDLTGLEGVASLRGAGMEWADIIAMAGVWAAALGIEVLDTD
jgi:uncharacterized protein YjbI with pentapeptide repeats